MKINCLSCFLNPFRNSVHTLNFIRNKFDLFPHNLKYIRHFPFKFIIENQLDNVTGRLKISNIIQLIFTCTCLYKTYIIVLAMTRE